jgi:ATP-binding cassette subfamily B protein
LRQHIAVVTQDVQLFHASIRDNMTLFNRSIGDEKIIQALNTLGLEDWYKNLLKGLDSWIESGGRGLSAGEAQLIAFTRVFLRDPGIVILDEASSRLDPVTEKRIELAIDKLLHQRTAVIIAHRLETLERADDILIIDSGKILEYGQRIRLTTDPTSKYYQLLQTGLQEVLA